MTVQKLVFGSLENGEIVHKYILSNKNGMLVEVCFTFTF